MTTNEAAERLHLDWGCICMNVDEAHAHGLTEGRAEERRHVIEQIRERLGIGVHTYRPFYASDIAAILDDLSTPEQDEEQRLRQTSVITDYAEGRRITPEQPE